MGQVQVDPDLVVPELSWATMQHLIGPAFTIALLGAIESLLSASVADGVIGERHRSNTELMAQGVANIIVPFFGGIPVTGAIARTMTNINNGARTPIAGITHALVLLLIFLFLMPLVRVTSYSIAWIVSFPFISHFIENSDISGYRDGWYYVGGSFRSLAMALFAAWAPIAWSGYDRLHGRRMLARSKCKKGVDKDERHE